jgi:hypothetical protein
MLLTNEMSIKFIKDNPKVMENFILWYPDYCNEYTCMPDINTFFDMAFRFQASTWIDFFYNMGIIISTMGEETIVWLAATKNNRYNLVSANNKKTIFEIHADNDPTSSVELAVVNLIKLINKPF